MSKIVLRKGNVTRTVTHIGPGAQLKEGLDGEQTMRFTLLPEDAAFIDFTTRIEFEGQYYDPKRIVRRGNALGAFADVEAEHVAYRLNEYTHGQISLNGSYSAVLARILDNTGLTAGSCISGTLQGGVMENVTAREALMTAVGYMGGEVSFSGLTVSVVAHRGSTSRVNIMDTGQVTEVQTESESGENEASYRIALGRRGSLKVGDEIRLVYAPFSIDVNTRIISMTRNPYNDNEVTVEVGRHLPEITDSFVQAQVKAAADIDLAKDLASSANQAATRAQQIAHDVAEDMQNRESKGYITFEQDANGGTEAIYFSATKPISGAVRYWKWSMNGLAYTDDGGATWNVGITADGKIMGSMIAAGSISADVIDTSTLRVKEVWYYDTFNLYRMLRSVVSGQNTWTNIGPEQIDNNYAQVLNCYGTQIYFKGPGIGYDVQSGARILSIDTVNYRIDPIGTWNIGYGDFNSCHSFLEAYIENIYFSRLVNNGGTFNYEYGTLYMTQNGHLMFNGPNGSTQLAN